MSDSAGAPADQSARRWTPVRVAQATTAAIWLGLTAYAVLVAASNDPSADGIGWGLIAFVVAGLVIALPLTGLVWLVALVLRGRTNAL